MFRKIVILSLFSFIAGHSFAAMVPVDTWIEQCENAKGETKKTYEAIRSAKAYFGKVSCKKAYFRLLDNKLEIQEPISDLGPISGLTNLEYLAIFGQYNQENNFEDLSPLSKLTNLKELYLGASGVVSIKPLAALTNLEVLWLNRNKVDDITPVADMIKLRKLHLASNRIVDVRPLSMLWNLEFLDLRGNLIQDLKPLRGSTYLAKYVYLGNNYIQDLRPLQGKVDIKFLNIDGNKVTDFSPLVGIQKVYKGYQFPKKKYPKIPVKPVKLQTANVVKPKANFYARIMEKPASYWEFYKQAHDLAELVEDVHQMKLYYTFVSNAYRMKLITQQERSELVIWGLGTAADYTTCENSIADYKIILDKAEHDRLIDRKTRYVLDSKAEDKKTENQPYIRDLQRAVKQNTEHLQLLESNVEAINNSLNQLKEGIRHKMAIESTVGFISAVLNALSFGVAGSAVQGAMELTLGQIVDFGDIAHILEVAEGVNDVQIQEIIEYALEQAEDSAEDKLEEACKESYTLAVLTIAAVSINPQPHKMSLNVDNFDYPFLSDLDNDSRYDFDLQTFDEEDHPLHAAIKYGDVDLLKAELDCGDHDINKLDKKGRTPTDFAALNGNFEYIEMVKLLKSKGGTLTNGSLAKTRNLAKKRKEYNCHIKKKDHLHRYKVRARF